MRPHASPNCASCARLKYVSVQNAVIQSSIGKAISSATSARNANIVPACTRGQCWRAELQAPLPILVLRHAHADGNAGDFLRPRASAAARTQTLPACMEDAPQTAQCHGQARRRRPAWLKRGDRRELFLHGAHGGRERQAAEARRR